MNPNNCIRQKDVRIFIGGGIIMHFPDVIVEYFPNLSSPESVKVHVMRGETIAVIVDIADYHSIDGIHSDWEVKAIKKNSFP
jgi:hypothetical protein